LEEIGTKLGITRERIRQIQMGALKKMRREMARKDSAVAAR
jgi:DNA-directed RNA polymerase sigma subunit (sigma70/sigma32)